MAVIDDILPEADLCAIADAWHKRGLIKWLDDNRIPYVFAGRCTYGPVAQYPCGFQQDWGCSVLLNYHIAYRL